MDVIRVPLVPLVDSTNRKIGTFQDNSSFLDQLKKPDNGTSSIDEDDDEEVCQIIGETPLHIAIMYDDLETIEYIVEARGFNVNQRCVGGKYNGSFKDKETAYAIKKSEYENLAYYGEYPLCLAACFASKEVYDYLLDKGADPNLKDSNGNTLLHVLVINNKIEMFLYACNHPKIKAQVNTKNCQNLTPFNLAAKLGRIDMFSKILELNIEPFWYYNNVGCVAYPLEGVDTIDKDGKIDKETSLPFIINGDSIEHLDMLNNDVIDQLLMAKWDGYIKKKFYTRLVISLLHLTWLSVAVYTRAGDSPNLAIYPTTDSNTIARYVFECLTILFTLFSVFIQCKEIYRQGFKEYWLNLITEPGSVMYQLFNFFILIAIPFRFVTLDDAYIQARHVEETFLCLGIPLGWLHLLFYLKVFKMTGPFVVMIYKMVIGDIAEFTAIYSGFLIGFTWAFYYFYKNAGTAVQNTFPTFPDSLHVTFQMSLGAFRYPEYNYVANSPFQKFVFMAFMIFIPIILMNLLIAMMGNTYHVIIAISEKEWRRQWAHCVVLLERSFSTSELKKFQKSYAYQLANKEPSQPDIVSLIVTKKVDVTKAKLKKNSNLSWSRLYNKVQKGRRENKCNSSRLLEIWKERGKVVQVVKVKKEKKAFDWAAWGGNPHKPAVPGSKKEPEKINNSEIKKMDLNDLKQPKVEPVKIEAPKVDEEEKKASFPNNLNVEDED